MNKFYLKRSDLDYFLFYSTVEKIFTLINKESPLIISRTFLRKNKFVKKVNYRTINELVSFNKDLVSAQKDELEQIIKANLLEGIVNSAGIIRLYKEQLRALFLLKKEFLIQEIRENKIVMKEYDDLLSDKEVVSKLLYECEHGYLFLLNMTALKQDNVESYMLNLSKLNPENLDFVKNYICLVFDILKLYNETISNDVEEI